MSSESRNWLADFVFGGNRDREKKIEDAETQLKNARALVAKLEAENPGLAMRAKEAGRLPASDIEALQSVGERERASQTGQALVIGSAAADNKARYTTAIQDNATENNLKMLGTKYDGISGLIGLTGKETRLANDQFLNPQTGVIGQVAQQVMDIENNRARLAKENYEMTRPKGLAAFANQLAPILQTAAGIGLLLS